MNILLAEPDHQLREELYKTFRKRGWRVITCTSRLEVEQLLVQHTLDALVINDGLAAGIEEVFKGRVVLLGKFVAAKGGPFESSKEVAKFLAKKPV